MIAWLTMVAELISTTLILSAFVGFGAAERIECSFLPSVLLAFGVVGLLGSSAAIAALQGAF